MIVAGDSLSRFEFAAPGRIVFGPGSLGSLPGEVAPFGRKVLLVTGSRPQRLQTVVEGMQAAGLTLDLFSVDREPTVGMVREGVGRASTASVDVVVGIGGGSVMDAAKAIAALLGNGGDPLDYLEVVGAGRPLGRPSVPLFLAPTTAGTGTEATKNAVLLSEQHHVKVSLRGVGLLPRLALVDPELTYGLPPEVTAWGGLDALTQLIEPYVGCRPQPITDALGLEGMRRIARSLRRAFHDGGDVEARIDLSLAALFSGIALANAGLGVVHGFAGVIGGMIDAHHGMVCASLLPAGMRANLTALRARAPSHPSLRRHAELAAALTGHADASPEDGIAWVQQLSRELGVPRLSQMGLKTEDLDVLVERTAVASSTKGNPIPLTRDELLGIVQASW
jgi:alcohol dehydrogenase class IV